MTTKKVAFLTTNFFHPTNERIIMGGAERYQVDLCRLLRELGFYVEIWQIGSGWTQEFDGVRIRSIPVSRSEYHTFPELSTAFYENSMAFDYAIYFILTLAYPIAREKSIAISHGIFWDWPGFDLMAGRLEDRQEWLRRLGIALIGPQKLISVDTNTINFFNATLPGFYHKWEYIPNYVDTDLFHPPEEVKNSTDTIRVLFPRRLVPVRGINETMRAAERLTARYPWIEFHFCGRGHDDNAERLMSQWIATQERCFYYWKPLEMMPEVYRQADIVIIPSRSTEGTSLAALEAMASGRPVIAGLAGGLSDIILHGYNGYLIKPTVENLVAAIEDLARDKAKRQIMGQRAREVALTFNRKIWAERWARVLETVFR
ncbi:GDP-mannose-dependent alpha-(1-6)-phosphatidylinositol monomannoside mannosyltransferase [Neomoorella glycerini]|uniref:GDP-mannose-dependent alpha-(1-6)-phosphatidylinositol monomannoside mannosyltransferase n=1 Tax=Neomoorella glycerini TaxID=55779 RepID=A0A6I5ZUR7_9FIRM|nr:glycosyltransferase family 4 protein [Moorella glycerini]QGP93674.1 GDP-mannose-dependent alpha-(1-6)-phosphatidylinositol monomannoside mannosyltransferase [Moorella glycerini]